MKNNSNLELRKFFLQTIYFKFNFRVRFNLIENDLKSHSNVLFMNLFYLDSKSLIEAKYIFFKLNIP